MRGKEQLIMGLKKMVAIFSREVLEGEESRFEFSDEAKEALRELILRDNPRGSEAWFMAVGKGFFVEKVYTPNGFSEKSGFRFTDPGAIGSGVGFEELKTLFEEVHSAGGGEDNVLFLGHLHPSGIVDIEGMSIELSPSEWFLRPSEKDLLRFESELEKGLAYHAIASNTENGPCIAIYPLKPTLKRRNLKKLPRMVINLSA